MTLHVAVVTRDREVRERAARGFDGAPREWRITLDGSPPDGADVVVTGPDVEATGDFVFDGSRDLVESVRSIAASGARCLRLRVGGLPGSGRTSVSLHAAAALAKVRSVCLIDRDAQKGAAHRLLIDDPLVYAGGDVLSSAIPVRGGFRLLTCDGLTRPDEIALERFDAVVVDGEAFEDCDLVLLQPTVPQARRLRAALGDVRPPLVVTNRLGRGGGATRRDLERVLGRRIALELPHSPALRDAEDGGDLVPTWTRWWRGLERLVGALVR